MFRKLSIIGVAVSLVAASGAAWADHDRYGSRYEERSDRYGASEYDYAQVVDVQPIRRQVRVSEPVRECWNETSYASDGPFSSNHVGSTLLGGLIGGVVGNQIGSGRGRTVARVAGAIAGGAIGHRVSQNRLGSDYRSEQVTERCEVRYRDSWDERIDGYDVTYQYGGREHTTRMAYDPGDRIRVRVDVRPVSD